MFLPHLLNLFYLCTHHVNLICYLLDSQYVSHNVVSIYSSTDAGELCQFFSFLIFSMTHILVFLFPHFSSGTSWNCSHFFNLQFFSRPLFLSSYFPIFFSGISWNCSLALSLFIYCFRTRVSVSGVVGGNCIQVQASEFVWKKEVWKL